MKKDEIITYLKYKKKFLKQKYGITTIGLYGSYARDEANRDSDVDIFYERDKNFKLKSGLAFLNIGDAMAKDLNVRKVELVKLGAMNPIIKFYAEKDFIYV